MGRKVTNLILISRLSFIPNLGLNDYVNENTENIIIYISAHGSTTKNKAPLILGIDAQYNHNGIVINSIYTVLSRLESRYKFALLLFDVCYSNIEGSKAVILNDFVINPIYTCKKVVSIHANTDGISYIYKDKNLSLFTYFLCKSIYDNRDKKTLTIRDLFRDIRTNVVNKAPQINQNWHQVPYIFPEDKPENEILDRVIINYK